MEDSFKGLLVTVTLISMFIIAILNFVVIFPQEQGIEFTGEENSTYMTMQSVSTDLDSENSLELVENQSNSGFDQWDIEVGFMGSNTQKGTKNSASAYSNNIFTNLNVLSTELFGANSPVVWALGVLAILASIYVLYLFIKFIRTGN